MKVENVESDDKGKYKSEGITNPHYLGVLTLHCQMQCCLLVAILDI